MIHIYKQGVYFLCIFKLYITKSKSQTDL